jgi:AraC family transcriptional regulator, regulatory protein of adaptative response / methylated-DNA-[protein]-cysteine methyltransferase
MSTAHSFPDQSTAWRAVQQRDRRFDGRFVYAVSSTRIFCRPSCSSRRPTRARVEFFGSPADAERAGYRACKRCRPTSGETPRIDRAVTRAAEFLARHADEPVTLASLAREVGVSAFHLQRAFKRALGISPREYRDAERRRRLAERLRKGDTVSRATYEAGFGSSSRVYERASSSMGMTPATLRKGGAGARIQFSIVSSPLGRLLAAYTERGVCAVAIGDDDRQLEKSFRADFPEADIRVAGPAIHEWISAIVRSLEGDDSATAIPVDARGTAFQRRVWNALQQIPRGTTLSYGDVARQIGQPTAVRAVARACATNPVALVIPCHRVVREDGDLGGYRWGVDRKRKLLDKEQSMS